MTPHEFIAKWRHANLSERAAAQSHFNDLCRLLGQPDPITADPAGEWFTFEKGTRKASGGRGWADVWKRGCFAWEYKRKGADLAAAHRQLRNYSGVLEKMLQNSYPNALTPPCREQTDNRLPPWRRP